MINKNSKIYIAGHNGMVGSAIYKKLNERSYQNLIVKNRKQLNLLDQKKTFAFLKKNKPDFVIIAAAKAGGIIANSKFKDKFLYENLQIQNNLIHGAYLAGVKNLIFLGSSCIYPKHCPQPMKETYLLSGPLEDTNDAYAIAKIAGLKLCQFYKQNLNVNYFTLIPPNLFGPKDNYDTNNSHFFPALIKKIYFSKINKKKNLNIWGSGKPKRELMFSEDFAEALIFFMKRKINDPYINIGTGKDYSISWYANLLMDKLNAKLKIKYDKSKPDGMPKKCMNISLSKKYGWKPKNNINLTIKKTFKDFLTKYFSTI